MRARVPACVCVSKIEKINRIRNAKRNCNMKTDSAIELKFGVLEELIVLFHRDELDWNIYIQ